MSSPLDRADLRQRVQKSLSTFFARQHARLGSVSDDVVALLDAVDDLSDGGKRLRPAFCYWGWRGAGGDDGDEIIEAATALELFQACALIHDDVMDGSDTRRGRPAVHRRFAAMHRGEGWRGDPEGFGTGAAILLGDLCLSWSDEMLARSGLSTEALHRGKQVYDAMRTELMAGQYLDLLEQAMGGGSVERAMRVLRFKSAKYTIERPLHLGAALADADEALVAAYSGYGVPLGEAFQLRDDVLGVFGNPAETGKPAGDDLREGKRTALIAFALDRGSPAQCTVVRRYLGDPHLDERGVAALREVLTDTGALDAVEAMIARLYDDSLHALETATLPDEPREVLAALALAATERRV